MRSVLIAAAIAFGLAAPADAQWIVGAYAGTVHTRPADLTIEQPERGSSLLFEAVPFEGKSFESPIYYGYRIARVISPRRGIFLGGELIHAKAYADGTGVSGTGVHRGTPVQAIPFRSVVQRFAISHGLNFVLVNAGIRRPVSNRIAAVATAGAGPMVPHTEAEVDGVGHEGYELAGVGVQAAAGIDVRVWRRVALITEYKWTRAAVRLSLGQGQAELTTTSHHLAVGVSAAFGRVQ